MNLGWCITQAEIIWELRSAQPQNMEAHLNISFSSSVILAELKSYVNEFFLPQFNSGLNGKR